MPANSGATIRVLVVDEVRLMGNVTASVLKHEPEIEVLGCATTFDEAVSLAAQSDVVLVSSSLPNDEALHLTPALIKAFPHIKVVVTGLSDAEAAILQHIEAGVSGYVLRDDSVEKMLATIHAVFAGEAVISPSVAAALMARLAELSELAKSAGGDSLAPPAEAVPDLTPREREVLSLIALGLSNSEIAERLTLELGTVKNHVHHILEKLNVSSRQDAVAYLAALEESLSASA
jgi:DNA-binding NarL/FixJ family response regulator